MKKKEISTTVPADLLAQLANSAPQEVGYTKLDLPRISFVSQDKFEGKGKNKKVTVEAGTFFIERPTDELNEHGKLVWDKAEVGLDMECFIVYTRKQLGFYDEPNDTFYSTPVYDENTDVIPLFAGKNKVATGTPAELKKSFEYTSPDGKVMSKLKDKAVLYVLYKDELFQLTIHGTSMYSWKAFARAIKPNYNVHLISITSEAQEKGTTEWNQMKFTSLRSITTEEASAIMENIDLIKESVELQKQAFANQTEDAHIEAAVLEALPAGNNEDDKDF